MVHQSEHEKLLLYNLGPNVTTAESAPEPMQTEAGPSESGPSGSSDGPFIKVPDDPVDRDLWNVDWTSVQSNHEKGTVIKMDKLKPEPWDAEYLRSKAIKFLSFHRYGFDTHQYHIFKNVLVTCES